MVIALFIRGDQVWLGESNTSFGKLEREERREKFLRDKGKVSGLCELLIKEPIKDYI
jgi:hypothetical protein